MGLPTLLLKLSMNTSFVEKSPFFLLVGAHLILSYAFHKFHKPLSHPCTHLWALSL